MGWAMPLPEAIRRCIERYSTSFEAGLEVSYLKDSQRIVTGAKTLVITGSDDGMGWSLRPKNFTLQLR